MYLYGLEYIALWFSHRWPVPLKSFLSLAVWSYSWLSLLAVEVISLYFLETVAFSGRLFSLGLFLSFVDKFMISFCKGKYWKHSPLIRNKLYSSIFLKKIYFKIVCVCLYVHMRIDAEEAGRVLGLLELSSVQSWATWWQCWERNSGPLQEQYSFFSSEPSLQLLFITFTQTYKYLILFTFENHALIPVVLALFSF